MLKDKLRQNFFCFFRQNFLSVYLSIHQFELGSIKSKVVRNIQQIEADGEVFIEKTSNQSKEII